MERHTETTSAARPSCPTCAGPAIRWGRDGGGAQRFRCKACGETFAERPVRPLGKMRLSTEKAIAVVSLLVEGASIRSTERITQVHRDTIRRLLIVIGGKCDALLARLVRGVEVKDVEADEVWGVVERKDRSKRENGIVDERVGSQWGWLAIELRAS